MGNTRQILLLIYNCFIFVAFSSNLGVDIIAAIVTQILVQFVTLPIIEVGSLNFTKVVHGLLDVLVVFTVCTLLHAVITYIAMIKARLSELILENLGLLDGMHEGIIVISGKDESIEFANAPAVDLIAPTRTEETVDQQKDLLSKPIFTTTKLSIAHHRQDDIV